MHENSMKRKIVSGALWKFLERAGSQIVSLIVSIILARLLTPDDYSVVSIVTMFFAFANVFISGGFNSALIQKKDADDDDYSTVLHISLIISVGIYVVLFFIAPFIADFYKQPMLKSVIRIMSLTLPITAVKSVWSAKISSSLKFKGFFISTFIATVISAVIGIVMAYSGAGPWALVAQQMSSTVISTVILMIMIRMRIVMKISFVKFKSLFKYGWKVFVSSIIGRVYLETIPIVIGFKYSTADLAYYTKGRSFPEIITSSATSTFSAVLFPALAKVQDSKERLLYGTRMFIRITSFITMPLMLGLFGVAENFVIVLLTEKWLPIVPYLKMFCIASMFEMVHVGNCETIKAMGRSDIYLIMEIIKKSGYFITIALFLIFADSPQVLALAFIVCTAIALAVNSIPNVKLINYTIPMQLADLLPNLITSAIMCAAVSFIGMLNMNSTLVLLLQIVSGMLVYLLLNILIKSPSLLYIFGIAKSILKRGEKTPL